MRPSVRPYVRPLAFKLNSYLILNLFSCSYAGSFGHLPTHLLITCSFAYLTTHSPAHSLICLLVRSFAPSFAHLPTCLLICLLARSFSPFLAHLLACSLMCLITRTFAYSLICPLARSCAYSLAHSPTRSFAYSLACLLTEKQESKRKYETKIDVERIKKRKSNPSMFRCILPPGLGAPQFSSSFPLLQSFSPSHTQDFLIHC